MRELITSYNLYVRIAFVGDYLEEVVTFLNEDTRKEGNSFVILHYFPPILTIKHNLTAVLFQDCQDPLIFRPDLEPECIFTAKRLAKVAWKPVQNRAPELFNFIENFSFEYAEYIELLESYINTSDTTTPIKHTSCVYNLKTMAIFIYPFSVPSGQFDAMLQVGGVIRNPAVLDRPDPPAHSSAGVATIRDHIKPSHGDDPHSLHLVDPLPGHLEVHHDQAPHLGSQPVYWDKVQTGPNLWLCCSCYSCNTKFLLI